MILEKAKVNKNVKVIMRKKSLTNSPQKKSSPSANDTVMKGITSLYTPRRGKNSHLVYQPFWDLWGATKPKEDKESKQASTVEDTSEDKTEVQEVELKKQSPKHQIYQPGAINEIHHEHAAENKIIYIEPSVSEQRLKHLREGGRKFEDEDFPSNEESLCGPYGPLQEWSPIKWRRICYAIPDAKIFQGKIQPCDIKQGFLGDCYFLAGISALAEHPDRIFQLFLLREQNQMAYYSVKMLYRGKWRIIDIDDYVPFVFGAPAFSKSHKKQLWVIILEKAWAKIYGSYKQIEAGFPEEALHDLTGAPIKRISLKRKSPKFDEQWQYLLKSVKRNYAIVASTKPGSNQNQSPSGIFDGHAYTILNADYLSVQGSKVRIVQLRNPWGQKQYKGKWSDGDTNWNLVTQSEKKRIGYQNDRGDGVFFMDYDSFTLQFRKMTVAEVNDNASYVYDSFYDPQAKGAYFVIDILHDSKYSFQIDKTPERSFTGEKQITYRYPEALLQIAKIQGGSAKRLPGYVSRKRTLFKNYTLQLGQYIVWARVDFDPNFEEDFEVVLAIYGEFACGVRLATRNQAIIFEDGNTGIEWTGERKAKPAKKTAKQQKGFEKQEVPEIDERGQQVLFDFLKKNKFTSVNSEGLFVAEKQEDLPNDAQIKKMHELRTQCDKIRFENSDSDSECSLDSRQ